MENDKSNLKKILREICDEYGIECEGFSYDFIFRLKMNGKIAYVYGYKFPNNDAAASAICDDKAAVSEILSRSGVPAVTHHFFMSPENAHYIGTAGNYSILTALLKKYGKVVLKPNNGTGGDKVIKAVSELELEGAALEIFKTCRSLCLSPYIDVKAEYRVIICGTKPAVVFRKLRAAVTGDGKSNLAELSGRKYAEGGVEFDRSLDFTVVPKKGQTIEVSFKHNLGKGAVPRIVEGGLAEEISALALSAAQALGLRLCSVDIVDNGEKLLVLEVNSGVMTESFSSASPENYKVAKQLYLAAIKEVFSIR